MEDESDMSSDSDMFDDLGLGGGSDFGGDDLGGLFNDSGSSDDFGDFSDLEVGGEEESLPTPAEAGGGLDFTDEI